ncbi:hypothetical protein AB0H36_40550 [Kribbella sp. NPDC050820]|uniref:hypothetical protein n=1 Tax=Kribbella sp. NPDC050820 TaxID=3155408 RepID=UPI0034026589
MAVAAFPHLVGEAGRFPDPAELGPPGRIVERQVVEAVAETPGEFVHLAVSRRSTIASSRHRAARSGSPRSSYRRAKIGSRWRSSKSQHGQSKITALTADGCRIAYSTA